MPPFQKKLQTIALLASLTATALGAWSAYSRIRLVDFLMIFCGGLGVGVTLVIALRAMRKADAAKAPPATTPKSGA